MKVNWKVRFKNKVWLGSFLSLIVGFVYSMLALFDVFPAVTQNLVVQLLNQVLTFLGLIGVIVDPTTAGLSDSERALLWKNRCLWGCDVCQACCPHNRAPRETEIPEFRREESYPLLTDEKELQLLKMITEFPSEVASCAESRMTGSSIL